MYQSVRGDCGGIRRIFLPYRVVWVADDASIEAVLAPANSFYLKENICESTQNWFRKSNKIPDLIDYQNVYSKCNIPNAEGIWKSGVGESGVTQLIHLRSAFSPACMHRPRNSPASNFLPCNKSSCFNDSRLMAH